MSKLPSRYERGPIILPPAAQAEAHGTSDVLICLYRRDRCAAIGVAQWLRYPTPMCRERPMGKQPEAPTPRLPTEADFSGIWHAANPNRCVPGAGSQFIKCGTEIGGSPLGGNLGRNLPGGLPYQHGRPNSPGARARTTRRSALRCLPDNPPGRGHCPTDQSGATPKLLVLLYEVNAMSGNLHRRAALPEARTRLERYSIGRWEGDTLWSDCGLPRNSVDRHRRQPMSDARR